jgi:hypothetical protein
MSRTKRIAVAIVAMVFASFAFAAPAHADGGAGGCTSIQGKTGLLCVQWNGQSPRDINWVNGNFDSSWGVGNPRIHVRILDDQNRELWQNSRSWTGRRWQENGRFDVTTMLARPGSRVCATLYEAGGYVDTACSPIYF